MARRFGWTDDQLQNLHAFESRDDFAPEVKVALRYCERMTRDARTVDDALFAELKQHYTEPQIVELTAAIGLFNYFNRFNDALQMEPTAPGSR